SVYSFANNINTHEGGSHLSGFKAALTRTLNVYARDKGLLKEKEDNLEGEDVREGLAAVISVKLRDPQFEGQTKSKLGNPWVRGLVEQTVNQRLAEFLEENPSDARRIIDKAVSAARARQAARKARELTRRKSALESSSLPRRLAHPDADPHVPVPPDAGAGRPRARLHRGAAALRRPDRRARAVRGEGVALRGAARAGEGQGHRRQRPRRQDAEADGGALAALQPRAARVRGLGRAPAGRLRPRGGELRRRAPAGRDRGGRHRGRRRRACRAGAERVRDRGRG